METTNYVIQGYFGALGFLSGSFKALRDPNRRQRSWGALSGDCYRPLIGTKCANKENGKV